MSLNATLEALVAPIIAGLGYELVRVQMNGRAGAQTLQIMAEDPATGQLTLAQCSEISRALDEPLDAADPIEGEYALEVSSPGIDRPLTRPGDWTRWAGHEARLKLAAPLDGGPQAGRVALKGEIIGLEADAAALSVAGARVSVPLAQIASAKLVLTNKLIAATRPLDAGDADTVIDDTEFEPDNDN